MKASNLVVGKIYNFTRDTGEVCRAKYLGRCGKDTPYEGQHDFDPVGSGTYAGSVHTDGELDKISEIEGEQS